MKKILYVVTEDWYFWSHRQGLATAARLQGYEIHVLTRPGEFSGKITEQGFKLHPLYMSRSIGNLVSELNTLLKLCGYYRDIKPDLVHHIALKPAIFGSIAALITRTPLVINSYTGLGFLFISESLFSQIFRAVLLPVFSLLLRSKCFYSIVQNTSDKNLLTELGLIVPERTVLIRGSGVDVSHFHYMPEIETDSPVVLFASRLLKDKGLIEFIDAAKKIKAKGVKARFILVGDIDDGNPTSISHVEINSWLVTDLIEWWGHRDDMPEVFRLANIVCLPSYREGLPKILLEAAACGRSIVTTDVPGCTEVVIDNVNGLLVPVRDSDSLADAICKLLGSASLRQQMGLAGRKLVEENFAIQQVNTVTIRLYNDLLVKDNQNR